ncbi:MAG: SBBP repeat-containing protein [Proteobacteria bacterium]|nr:SBBP repeat-containing protein [Pseudomonadota bacterium]MBU1710421.1 SBBP repeat-containing protein [Pseudomonadota bacterium]
MNNDSYRIPVIISFLLAFSFVIAQEGNAQNHSSLQLDYQQALEVRLPFIKNIQPENDGIGYIAKLFSGAVAVYNNGSLTYSLSRKDKLGSINYLSFHENFNRAVSVGIVAQDRSAIQLSSYMGSDPENWNEEIPSFQKLVIKDIYPGIQLELLAYGDSIEKIFHLQPGAQWHAINVTIDGADLSINKEGELEINSNNARALFSKPIAYQLLNNKKHPVDISYVISGNTYGFHVGDYDPQHELVIDPRLTAVLLGPAEMYFWEIPFSGISGDSAGNIFIAGLTSSADFPSTPNSYNTKVHIGSSDLFIAKFDKDLKNLLAVTFIGGKGIDWCRSLSIDKDGDVYVAGMTASADFPVTKTAYDQKFNGMSEGFIVRFDNELRNLKASSLVNIEEVFYVTTPGNGQVYFAGSTLISGADQLLFPKGSLYDTTLNGKGDAFIGVMDTDLKTMVYATLIGGSDTDLATFLAVDIDGFIYAGGETRSKDFPVSDKAFDRKHSGEEDIFIAKFTSQLSKLESATLFGGSGREMLRGMVRDDKNNCYITGFTSSESLSKFKSGFDTTYNGGEGDGFVAMFDDSLHALSGFTYLGGKQRDSGHGISLMILEDWGKSVVVTGDTESVNFPATKNAYDSSYNNGRGDIFLTILDPYLTEIRYSTFLGGKGIDRVPVIFDTPGKIYISGITDSDDFASSPGTVRSMGRSDTYNFFVLGLEKSQLKR